MTSAVLASTLVASVLACTSFGDDGGSSESDSGASADAHGAEASTDAGIDRDASPPDGGVDSGADGLVAFIRFDEGAGVRAADFSPNHNDAALRDGATWTAGKAGAALSLNGTTAYAEIVSTASFASGVTIAAWLRIGIAGADQCIMVRDGAFELELAGRSPKLTNLQAGTNYSLSTGSIPIDEWHHLAVTFGNNAVAFYIDGLPTAANVPVVVGKPLTDNTSSFNVGKTGATCLAATGAVDDLRIYSRALTKAEIAVVAQ